MSDNIKAVLYCLCRTIDARFALKAMKNAEESLTFPCDMPRRWGKNSFYSFQQEDYNAFLRKEKIISALRCSIAEQYKGFNVYYQPIMDCATETVSPGGGRDLRWIQKKGREVISPIEFIPLLEETGSIVPAGNLSKKEAAKMCFEIRRLFRVSR